MKEWTTVDKSGWAVGPWQDEPDKVQWDHEGFDCLIVRGPSGGLCGYVGVPPSHPYYGQSYDVMYEQPVEIDVHGGLTFASECADTDDESRHICHTDGLCEDVWWFGFDCAHSGDLCPERQLRWQELGLDGDFETYKDLGYVKRETENLARQLREVAA